MDGQDEVDGTPLLTTLRRRASALLTPWSRRRSLLAGGLVLSTLFLERLAFYSLLSNFYIFLTNDGHTSWSSDEALSATLLLTGLAYFSALPAGWLADAVVGRYWTITGGLCLYIVAYAALTTLAFDGLAAAGCDKNLAGPWCSFYIYGVVVAIGLAVGTIKANVPAFGAEQMRHGGSMRVFFNWYYWCINSGALIGIGGMAYWEQASTQGFPAAFCTATVVLILALFLMLIGRRYFVVHQPAETSVLGSLLHMVKEGLSGRLAAGRVAVGSIQGSPIITPADECDYESLGSPISSVEMVPGWLDYAKIRYGGSHSDEAVDEAKKMGPVFLLLVLMVPFWLIFLQSNTGFQAQAVHLKVDLGNFMFPTAWLGVVDQIFVLALIPLVNGVLCPLLERQGLSLSLTTRIVIGMAFAAVAMIAAGGVETASVAAWKRGDYVTQRIGHSSYNASTVSILWQAPQYCLLGTSEVFATIGGLELAHSLAPRALQGLVMGLLSAFEGMASFLGIGLLAVLSPMWIQPDDTHFDGHYDYFFFLLAAMQVFTILLSLVVLCFTGRPPRARRRSQLA